MNIPKYKSRVAKWEKNIKTVINKKQPIYLLHRECDYEIRMVEWRKKTRDWEILYWEERERKWMSSQSGGDITEHSKFFNQLCKYLSDYSMVSKEEMDLKLTFEK